MADDGTQPPALPVDNTSPCLEVQDLRVPRPGEAGGAQCLSLGLPCYYLWFDYCLNQTDLNMDRRKSG